MRAAALLLALLPAVCRAGGGEVAYDRADSLRVVELLRMGARQPRGACLTLFYARQFVGRPYVGRTLEAAPGERLRVNLRQLDCTTLVETVCALALATRRGQGRWDDFTRHLRALRYRGGVTDGYASRNHYFSQWIESNEAQGLVREVRPAAGGDAFPFTAARRVDLHYMTRHPGSYPALRSDARQRAAIRALERASSGRVARYIPARLTGETAERLPQVRDGDILAVVTAKDGLDVCHVGFAHWCADGRLHLLNASSIHRRVVLEEMTLRRYLQRQPSRLGVRVVRLCE